MSPPISGGVEELAVLFTAFFFFAVSRVVFWDCNMSMKLLISDSRDACASSRGSPTLSPSRASDTSITAPPSAVSTLDDSFIRIIRLSILIIISPCRRRRRVSTRHDTFFTGMRSTYFPSPSWLLQPVTDLPAFESGWKVTRRLLIAALSEGGPFARARIPLLSNWAEPTEARRSRVTCGEFLGLTGACVPTRSASMNRSTLGMGVSGRTGFLVPSYRVSPRPLGGQLSWFCVPHSMISCIISSRPEKSIPLPYFNQVWLD
mmetsp:Transcript_42174/g.82738  ORF Transcript_42174/g.82738 Transcript_42174/m.82738 type:complete len:261 (-) Transcript_42174:97-879(-)